MDLDKTLFRNVTTIGGKTVAELNVKLAKISKYNYRLEHSKEEIDEIRETLGKSITEIGLKQLPICTPKGEVFAGGRRLTAFRELGLEWMPVIVEEADPLHQFVTSYAENKHRKEPNWFEEGKKFKMIISETGVSERELARMLGISVMQVSDKVRSYENLHKLMENDVRAAYTIPLEVARLISTSDIDESGRTKLYNMASAGAGMDEIKKVIALTNAVKALIDSEDATVKKKLEDEFKESFYTKKLDIAEVKYRAEELAGEPHQLSKVRVYWSEWGIKNANEASEFFKKYGGYKIEDGYYSIGVLNRKELEKDKNETQASMGVSPSSANTK